MNTNKSLVAMIYDFDKTLCDKDMQEYFKKQSWYRPLTNDVKLTKIEKENASFIKKYEDSIL